MDVNPDSDRPEKTGYAMVVESLYPGYEANHEPVTLQRDHGNTVLFGRTRTSSIQEEWKEGGSYAGL